MREIKFRAWAMEVMLYSGKDFTTIPVNGQALATKDGGMALNFKLMQYTGLKDKNGKEIYEGDIISCRGGAIRSVFFRQDYADYGAAPNGKLDDACSAWVICENGEIIGNIYSNPELLEETK